MPSRPPCRPSPIKARRNSRLIAAVLLLAGLLSAPPSIATTGGSAAKQAQLKGKQEELRGRLEALRRDLAKSEESRAEAADQLRGTETAISDANRRLHQMGDRRAAVQGELSALDRQSQRLNGQIANQQEELSRLLYGQYLHGDSDALQLLLSGRDPNETARDAYYLALLSRAKASLIASLHASLDEKRSLAAAARTKADELAEIERNERQQRATLIDQQRQRQELLGQIADRVKSQRHEIDTLKRNDQRLGRLIDNLAKIIAREAQQAKRAKKTKKKAKHKHSEPVGETAQLASYEPPAAAGAFARLRGKLPMPVQGEIANRFGSRRGDGGMVWKGLFIRAPDGAEVRAVADGQVVYADWLRGFGNLTIVDHGDDFLSIYGNNQSLLHQAGDFVRRGEPLATVGSSGGNPESGLYFELRHQGRPFDPTRWIGSR
jgi:septal ring factor EnvC (AmiA/AmiB activator)